jgi:serpin B
VKTSLIALMVATAGLAACSPSSDASSEHAQVDVVRSTALRDTAPTLTAAERDAFAKGQAAFAVDLYQAVRTDPEHAASDIFISPHSVSTALAMTYAGARGNTADEMRSMLHFGLPDARLHSAFDRLDLDLHSRGEDARGQDGQPFRLNVANSIWAQKGTPFEAPFLDTLAVDYDSGLNVVDFVKDTEGGRLAINAWVDTKTEHRIKDVLPEGSLDERARLVIVNAVYFNAAWSTPFNPNGTALAAFTRLDGGTVQMPMMHGLDARPYVKGDGFEAVELPYDGNELAMLVIAPNAGTFGTYEAQFSGDKALGILGSLQSASVDLSFPKLKLDGSFGLKNPLKSMGMARAFDADVADFTGMSPRAAAEHFHIGNVLHKTFLDLDEKGTEAAAATVVINDLGGGAPTEPAKPIIMNVDRPFIFAIVDHQTKTLVFLGRVVAPTAGDAQ